MASLLELPIEDVPNFRLAEDAWLAMQAWLGERGLFAIKLVFPDVAMFPVPKQHCMLSGQSPRLPCLHAVVGLWDDYQLSVVHDPHPDGTGLAGPPKYVTFLGKLLVTK